MGADVMDDLVGKTLRGFCGGMFGRESYGDKVIEAVGEDWVVVRELDTGEPQFCGYQERNIEADLREQLGVDEWAT
jgi:hypothetical protein